MPIFKIMQINIANQFMSKISINTPLICVPVLMKTDHYFAKASSW